MCSVLQELLKNLIMPYSYSDIEKRLLNLWYEIVRQNGSHVLFSNWKNTMPVPRHWNKDISIWVEKKIIKNTWLTTEEFKWVLRNKK